MDELSEWRERAFSDLREWLQDAVDEGTIPESDLERETGAAIAVTELKNRILDVIRGYVIVNAGTPYEVVHRALCSAEDDYRAEFHPELLADSAAEEPAG